MITVTPQLQLDPDELEFRFVRASGPGGQNVNKVATAVQLRFDAVRSPSLTDAVRARLLQLAGRRASSEGVILIDARRFRTQERNRADAIERLVELVRRAASPPAPRRKTRPPARVARVRLEGKRRTGEAKRRRGVVRGEDD